MIKSTSGEYGQFETSPEAIEPELLTAFCERRQTDILKTNYRIDKETLRFEARRFLLTSAIFHQLYLLLCRFSFESALNVVLPIIISDSDDIFY